METSGIAGVLMAGALFYGMLKQRSLEKLAGLVFPENTALLPDIAEVLQKMRALLCQWAQGVEQVFMLQSQGFRQNLFQFVQRFGGEFILLSALGFEQVAQHLVKQEQARFWRAGQQAKGQNQYGLRLQRAVRDIFVFA